MTFIDMPRQCAETLSEARCSPRLATDASARADGLAVTSLEIRTANPPLVHSQDLRTH
jgi:hypothetical protein